MKKLTLCLATLGSFASLASADGISGTNNTVNFGGIVVVTATTISFESVSGTPNEYTPEAPNTGVFAGLTSGPIGLLTSPTTFPVTDYITFNTNAGTFDFDLTGLAPGDSGTYFTVTPTTITLEMLGDVYSGSAASGSTPLDLAIVLPNTLHLSLPELIADADAPGGYSSFYNIPSSNAAVPEPTSLFSSLGAILLAALIFSARKRKHLS